MEEGVGRRGGWRRWWGGGGGGEEEGQGQLSTRASSRRSWLRLLSSSASRVVPTARFRASRRSMSPASCWASWSRVCVTSAWFLSQGLVSCSCTRPSTGKAQCRNGHSGSAPWCLPAPIHPVKLMRHQSGLASAPGPSQLCPAGQTPLTSLGLPQLGLSGCSWNPQVTGLHLLQQPFHLGQDPAQLLARRD